MFVEIFYIYSMFLELYCVFQKKLTVKESGFDMYPSDDTLSVGEKKSVEWTLDILSEVWTVFMYNTLSAGESVG